MEKFETDMSLFFASLNSGSNANCYFIGSRHNGILIDAGLSLRQTRARLRSLGISEEAIKAIFISHEHTDHVRALPELAAAFGVPVFASDKTWQAHGSFSKINIRQKNFFACGDVVSIQDLYVTCFSKKHDGVEPHSFVVMRHGVNIGVFTDIGAPCSNTEKYFSICDAALLESNYDEDMLVNGRYPFFLKRRISGGLGHLSNKQAFDFFQKFRSRKLQLLMLGHLSKENNRPEIVEETFSSNTGKTRIFVASRDEASPLFYISKKEATVPIGVVQMSLF